MISLQKIDEMARGLAGDVSNDVLEMLTQDIVKYLIERYLDGVDTSKQTEMLQETDFSNLNVQKMLDQIDETWLSDYCTDFNLDEFIKYYEIR